MNTNINTKFKTTLLAQAAALATCGAAWAQPASEAQLRAVEVQGSRDGSTLQLATPSNTASRLGLTLRETPASVEILSQDVIQQRGARTFSEALRGAAGVTGGGAPASPTTVQTRGFSNITYLYDGMRSSGAGFVNRVQDTWNYERIEILKGPASVLYGDGAIGGVINFITKRPDRENPSREALVSYGSYGSYRAAAGLGGALGEAGAYRIDYSRNDTRVGTIANNGEKIDHLTTGLAFDLGRALRLDLSFDYLRDDNQAYYGTPLVPASFATQPTGVVSTPDGRVIDRRLVGLNYNIADQDNSSDTYWFRGRLTWRPTSQWTVRNELSANKADRVFLSSESAVFVAPGRINRDQTLITHDQNYVFNRLDASHDGKLAGLRNRFTIGSELSKTGFDSQRRFSNGSPATVATLQVDALNPEVGVFNRDPALTTGAGNRTDVTSDTQVASAFVEDALSVTDALTLVGGLRHDRIEVERSIRDLNTGNFTQFDQRYSANAVRLGAVYDITKSSTVYAQYTNATVPVSALFLLSAANAAFPLSRGKQVEVGFKQSLPEARLEWTAAVYRIELDDVLSRDAANPNVTVNNGQQSSRGIELAAAWRATRQLTLSGNYAALDARFDSLVEAGGVSRVGNTPANVPERVANVFATYRLADVPVEFFLGVNRTSHMYTDTANTIRINGYTVADAAVSWWLKPALLSFRVRNLTDKLYANYAGRATSQVLIAPGRTFEVAAKFDF
ncbi:TonB-dependent receptor [Ramlibacter tataouinensis]|uniref:Outer membrane protein, TonB-dependent receptor-like protein n=1 Tax=Ramlibacter tataouinensis (strain ATCC BAA-407 / DSM 14655 / LMG 21543 / TTB310) TaxID=365046 RepID=F5XW19_RAMTT|nr:TonB-dependent receptor [Ramlibacter tataouinensis]AEG94122.1 outer membrane protein precursor, TonB-dependent receptor-like protein [Ramlibacter tataouinensis TTB310]